MMSVDIVGQIVVVRVVVGMREHMTVRMGVVPDQGVSHDQRTAAQHNR